MPTGVIDVRRLARRYLIAGLTLLALSASLIALGCSLFRPEKADQQTPPAPGVVVSPPAVAPPPASAPVEEPRQVPVLPPPQSASLPSTQLAQPPPPDPMDIAINDGILTWNRGELLRAREMLNGLLHKGCPADRQSRIREILTQIADKTIFSPDILPDDPLVFGYRVARGDTLSRIARKHDLTEELISSINRLSAGSVLRPGRQLKVVRGPFIATVVKSTHEMHLYLQDLYIRTCEVALGTNNKTPTGKWVVTTRLRHPSWVDPRTGKQYGSHDPDNPLGGYWIGLKGIEGDAVGQRGYGIHGTNDEASIGTDASLGCVRLGRKDIESVYMMLARGSIVTIAESDGPHDDISAR
ncbi:MAG: L,D-transpeptidase family protein [Phycisphaerae bacterium]